MSYGPAVLGIVFAELALADLTHLYRTDNSDP